jgi:hypothetical protein
MGLTAEPLGRRVAVVTHRLVRGEAASTEPIADALLAIGVKVLCSPDFGDVDLSGGR